MIKEEGMNKYLKRSNTTTQSSDSIDFEFLFILESVNFNGNNFNKSIDYNSQNYENSSNT